MKTSQTLSLLLVSLVLTACVGGSTTVTMAPPSGPAPAPPTDIIRVGDRITIHLSGVPDDGYLIELQIPASGDIRVSYLTQAFHAAGRNAGDLAVEIANAYKNEKIYTNPNVTVLPEERFVNVGGDVRSPTRVNYTPDLTLLTTIISCGGFTDYADRRHVRIIRGSQIILVDCARAAKVPGADPAVFPGDQIIVPRTMF